MSKTLTLVVIRLLLAANLLYAAIFLKFAGVPTSLGLFTHMSQAVHGLAGQSTKLTPSFPETRKSGGRIISGG